MGEAKALIDVAAQRTSANRSIRGLLEAADPNLDDPEALRSAIRDALFAEPEAVEAWQTYSYDKRSGPSPYLDDREVGFYDHARTDVVRHADRLDACADFICREAFWVLRDERVRR